MTLPHYAMPLRIVNGRFATVEDGSGADISQSVGLLVATEPGERLTAPDYGVSSQLFSSSIDPTELLSQIERWEKRAGKVEITATQNGENMKISINARGGT